MNAIAFIRYQQECLRELERISSWWEEWCVDHKNGGFFGHVDNEGVVASHAEKGIVQNARILWFFCEYALFSNSTKARDLAELTYNYISDHFVDREYGGVFWSVSFDGRPLNKRKQTYALAFLIYGLCSYIKLTKCQSARALLNDCHLWIKEYCYDKGSGGFIEAFDQDWSEIGDYRLSDKDINAPKTMDTHIHILEAYTVFYSLDNDDSVQAILLESINCITNKIYSKTSHHLDLYLTNDWNPICKNWSYGHEIELSWLLTDAVFALGESEYLERYSDIILKMVNKCLDFAVGSNGELFDQYDWDRQLLNPDRVWWVQAEALIGFFYAYKLTGNTKYFRAFENTWAFIKNYQMDTSKGEWHWLSTLDLPKQGDCKAGFWKCPYHNGRAMLKCYKLLKEME